MCKELGIHTKEEIEAYGVERFVRRCIDSVFRYTREWEEMTRRLGFWVNLDEAEKLLPPRLQPILVWASEQLQA